MLSTQPCSLLRCQCCASWRSDCSFLFGGKCLVFFCKNNLQHASRNSHQLGVFCSIKNSSGSGTSETIREWSVQFLKGLTKSSVSNQPAMRRNSACCRLDWHWINITSVAEKQIHVTAGTALYFMFSLVILLNRRHTHWLDFPELGELVVLGKTWRRRCVMLLQSRMRWATFYLVHTHCMVISATVHKFEKVTVSLRCHPPSISFHPQPQEKPPFHCPHRSLGPIVMSPNKLAGCLLSMLWPLYPTLVLLLPDYTLEKWTLFWE